MTWDLCVLQEDCNARANTLVLCTNTTFLYHKKENLEKKKQSRSSARTYLATSRAILIRIFQVKVDPREGPKFIWKKGLKVYTAIILPYLMIYKENTSYVPCKWDSKDPFCIISNTKKRVSPWIQYPRRETMFWCQILLNKSISFCK